MERRTHSGVSSRLAAAGTRKATKELTELRVQVTGGDEGKAVRGATVYVEWQEDGSAKHKEGTTNSQGVAGPYRVPRGKVFIQVTTDGDEWEKVGGDYELNAPEVTIAVNLKARKPPVSVGATRLQSFVICYG